MGEKIIQINQGKKVTILPVFNYTFTFLKADVNTGMNNFWDNIKILEGSARFAMRGSFPWGAATYFAELGASSKHGTNSLSTALYQLVCNLGFTGRIVKDVTRNDPTGYLADKKSVINRVTIAQFKYGGSGDASDAG